MTTAFFEKVAEGKYIIQGKLESKSDDQKKKEHKNAKMLEAEPGWKSQLPW